MANWFTKLFGAKDTQEKSVIDSLPSAITIPLIVDEQDSAETVEQESAPDVGGPSLHIAHDVAMQLTEAPLPNSKKPSEMSDEELEVRSGESPYWANEWCKRLMSNRAAADPDSHVVQDTAIVLDQDT